MFKVKDIMNVIEIFAPTSLAQKGDNIGLLVGDRNAEVTKVLLALDITNDVVDEAVKKGCNVILSHHPVIYNPLYSLDLTNPACRALANNINCLCYHTNVDISENGINNILCEILDLKIENDCFEIVHDLCYKQLVVFVPVDNAREVYTAMCNAGGGQLGDYKDCAFSVEGMGRFKPIEGANPYIGEVGEMEEVKEVRLEMLVKPQLIKNVVTEMIKAHPYEEPAYTVIDNEALSQQIGYGKICRTLKAYSPKEFAEFIKERLGCSVVRYTDGKKEINRVAICSGGGGSLVPLALGFGVDAYISGDFKHDQFIKANNEGLSVYDAGHFHTENVVMIRIKEFLEQQLKDIEVMLADKNTDPVKYA